MKPAKKTFFAPIYDFFCSLKLTLVTLLLLAATSIIGTVVQQGLAPREYIQLYGEKTYRLLAALDVFDMYLSWWFLGLIILFTANLTACSAKRLPRVWKTVRDPVLVADDAMFRSTPSSAEFAVKGHFPVIEQKVAAFLGQSFANPVTTRQGETMHLFAQKGAWARFGVYTTHLSILIIFIGAIIGNIWGFKAYVNITEGTVTDKAWPRGSEQPIDLGFTVRANDFQVTYYDGTTRPKEFMSLLDVIDNGQEVVKDRKVVVNAPLSYKGITFYQSSYGAAGEPVFQLRAQARDGGEALELSAPLGEHLPLPGGYSFAVTDYTPSYDRFGPAIQIPRRPAWRPLCGVTERPRVRPPERGCLQLQRSGLGSAAIHRPAGGQGPRSVGGLDRLRPAGFKLAGGLFRVSQAALGHPQARG